MHDLSDINKLFSNQNVFATKIIHEDLSVSDKSFVGKLLDRWSVTRWVLKKINKTDFDKVIIKLNDVSNKLLHNPQKDDVTAIGNAVKVLQNYANGSDFLNKEDLKQKINSISIQNGLIVGNDLNTIKEILENRETGASLIWIHPDDGLQYRVIKMGTDFDEVTLNPIQPQTPLQVIQQNITPPSPDPLVANQKASHSSHKFEKKQAPRNLHPEIPKNEADAPAKEFSKLRTPREPKPLSKEEIKVIDKNSFHKSLLSANGWLNGGTMQAYFQLLRRRSDELQSNSQNAPKCIVAHEYLSKEYSFNKPEKIKEMIGNCLREKNLKNVDKVLMFCDVGNHWVLMEIDIKNRQLKIHDSMADFKADPNDTSMSNLEKIGRQTLKESQQALRSIATSRSDARKFSISGVEKLSDVDKWEIVYNHASRSNPHFPKQGNSDDCGVYTCKFAEWIMHGNDFSKTELCKNFDESLMPEKNSRNGQKTILKQRYEMLRELDIEKKTFW